MSKDNKEKKNGILEEGQGYKKSKFRREHQEQPNKKTKKEQKKGGNKMALWVCGWEEKGEKKDGRKGRGGQGRGDSRQQRYFFGQNFARFQHEKYDFNLQVT